MSDCDSAQLHEQFVQAIQNHQVGQVMDMMLSNVVEIDEAMVAAAEESANMEIIPILMDEIIYVGPGFVPEEPTLLHWAIKRRLNLCALYLAGYFVDTDLEIIDNGGKTVLDRAIEADMIELVEILTLN
ncbi:MAG: hypothetical protein NTW50_03945 [Candidatus Berkelbacteria bacterium]|nr:hypothetical protein [Candidatus Berkelbacteria bacterium]